MPAIACCPRDTTCFSLLCTSKPCPAAAGLGSARPTGPLAVCCALLRLSGEAYRPLACARSRRPSPGHSPQQELRALPLRARHHPPHRALGSFPPMGRSASQRLRRKRLRRSGFAAAATPLLGPHLFRGHSVCTGVARFSQRDRRRFARCLPPLSIGFVDAIFAIALVSRRRPSTLPSISQLRSPAPRTCPRAASGRPAFGRPAVG